jgi:adenylate cyclase
MVENSDHRKLTAILCADVKGYSKLMGEDESYTVGALKECRKLFAENIQNHGGRVVNAPGDSILAEFPSVVSAVKCAVEIQNQLNDRNAELPDNRKMVFRIGVNLGDVIHSENAIYGDGVNIAARIEALAEPEGVSISRTVFNHVQKKLPYGYEYQGEHQVKNITNPVKVYKLLTAPEDAGRMVGMEPPVSASNWIWPTVVVAAIVLTLIGYQVYQEITGPEFEPASIEKMAYALPDKPSIAVLPFINMSDDPKKESLSDGITEQIITSLSKIHGLFVISRTSTFSYKNKPIKIQQVAEELGVNYVLEGSVQQSGDKLRITAQLIDALTGRHIWAERYERNYENLFALQDEITLRILNELQVKLTEGERIRSAAYSKATNLEAFEKAMEALSYIRKFNPESNAIARRLAEESIKLDPNYSISYYVLATVHMMDVWLGISKSPKKSLEQTVELLQRSIAIDENSDVSYSLLCHVYAMRRQFEKSLAAGQKAIEINPNSDIAYVFLAMTLRWVGRPEEAIKLHKKAMRLCPFPPSYYYQHLGSAYLAADRCEEAIEQYKKALNVAPKSFFAFQGLSVCYGLLGREDESKSAAEKMMEINSNYTIKIFNKTTPYKDRDFVARLANVLQKAGVPD